MNSVGEENKDSDDDYDVTSDHKVTSTLTLTTFDVQFKHFQQLHLINTSICLVFLFSFLT